MRNRLILFVFLLPLWTGCGVVQQWRTLVSARLQAAAFTQFAAALGQGATDIVSQLAQPGGFLNDPRVRILLPPPLGLAVGVVAELKENPDARLLEVLLNQAAEHAIPVAGPVLAQAVGQLEPATVGQLLNGDPGAATQYLRERTETELRQAVLPEIAAHLSRSGALRTYGDLRRVITGARAELETVAAAPLPEPPADLSEYVAGQAVAGVFRPRRR